MIALFGVAPVAGFIARTGMRVAPVGRLTPIEFRGEFREDVRQIVARPGLQ